MVKLFTNFMDDEHGAVAAEYAILIAFIITALIPAVMAFARELNESFAYGAERMDETQKKLAATDGRQGSFENIHDDNQD